MVNISAHIFLLKCRVKTVLFCTYLECKSCLVLIKDAFDARMRSHRLLRLDDSKSAASCQQKLNTS